MKDKKTDAGEEEGPTTTTATQPASFRIPFPASMLGEEYRLQCAEARR